MAAQRLYDACPAGQAIHSIAFSEDGQRVAVGGNAGCVTGFEKGNSLWQFGVPDGLIRPTSIRSVSYIPGRDQVCVATEYEVWLVSAINGEVMNVFEPPKRWGFLKDTIASAVALGPGLVLAATESGAVSLLRDNWFQQHSWHATDAPTLVDKQVEDDYAIGSDGITVRAWMSRVLEDWSIHPRDRIVGLGVGGGRVAVRLLDKIGVWEIGGGQIGEYCAAPPGLPHVAVSPDGTVMAYTAEDRVLVRNIDSGVVEIILTEAERPTAVRFSPAEPVLAIGLQSGRLLMSASRFQLPQESVPTFELPG